MKDFESPITELEDIIQKIRKLVTNENFTDILMITIAIAEVQGKLAAWHRMQEEEIEAMGKQAETQQLIQKVFGS